MVCSYCGSENSEYAETCSFCDAPLKKQRPKMREFVYLDKVELSFDQLSIFHAYDLLVLLRLVREVRSKLYNLMRSVQKDPEEVVIGSNTRTFAESEYKLYRASMKVIGV
ncbi:hypothetical protein [Metabacillus rhizolycopersici]|uniref:Zinc ribbon domain-containing protein n=1 Tax=Metabacillus rhizolycopersici TaxID=2875709 RepID=A0ABS7V0G0_9BACI|nr:hypothetical protein [Metabacillus rhizolycopersici]MBZ5753753.1 hypothetical protein [Metabacillus rhizolycopersici]